MPPTTADVKRELIVRVLQAWAPAALHSARRATYVHAYADRDDAQAADAALRALADAADVRGGRSLTMLALAGDLVPVRARLDAAQAELRLPAQLAVHPVAGALDARLTVALKAAGARGAPLLGYVDATQDEPPAVATLAAFAIGRPTDLLMVRGPAADGGYPELVGRYRAALGDAGLPLVAAVELVVGEDAGPGELLVFGTSAGRHLESFKDALWAVDEYAGVRYRDPADPDGHLLDISLRPHPGPLRRELLARVAAVGEATVTELRDFALTQTVYRAADTVRVLASLLEAGNLSRRPVHGRLGGDVVIGPGRQAPH